MGVPAEVWKLDGISSKAYQHPGDSAATAALGKVPYLEPGFRSSWVNGSPDLSGGAWVFGLFGRVRPCAHARVGSRALLRRM
ncbi:MAG: hypothetical protein H0T19_01850 [Thermoleophilaceae bacterium]|nr:hypothetical protein [Thermoleophilaceae bacterium]